MLPESKTVDGYETQFATNVLGELITHVTKVIYHFSDRIEKTLQTYIVYVVL